MVTTTLDSQTAVIIGLVSNIVLAVSVQVQRYAKKQIVHLALHGLPPLNFKLIWNVALSLLLVAECTNLIQYGLSPHETISAIGVFTIVCNVVLPPLMFVSNSRTVTGCLLSMTGILLLILKRGDVPEVPDPLVFDRNTRLLILAELASCICAQIYVNLDPGHCVRKFMAPTMMSGLIGSFSVASLQYAAANADVKAELVVSFLIVCWILQVFLMSALLHSFPVWQVLPHHFMIFTLYMFLNNGIMFHAFRFDNLGQSLLSGTANLLGFAGAWIGARPKFDLPTNLLESGALAEIAGPAKQKMGQVVSEEYHAALHPEAENPDGNCRCLDSDQGYLCLCEVYRTYKSEQLRRSDGYVLQSFSSGAVSSSSNRIGSLTRIPGSSATLPPMRHESLG